MVKSEKIVVFYQSFVILQSFLKFIPIPTPLLTTVLFTDILIPSNAQKKMTSFPFIRQEITFLCPKRGGTDREY